VVKKTTWVNLGYLVKPTTRVMRSGEIYRKQMEKNYEAPCSNRFNVDGSNWEKK
jgi:hypothetical protein